jgi:hypothetical protein
MTTSVYQIHRAIGRPIYFRGLKGQYILLAAAALIADFLFLIILYCAGAPTWLNIALTFGLGASALAITSRLSRKYGRYGLMKHFAAKRLPRHLRCPSRQIFLTLKKRNNETSTR